ncbi:sporulation protein Cse60 [Alicyclobacillus sp. SO9]|nr:sporulation protein Cse60 [Alicyclobacillus sp. SO9]
MKIFRSTSINDLEESINRFIQDFSSNFLIDIKYTMSSVGSSEEIYSALILYKTS